MLQTTIDRTSWKEKSMKLFLSQCSVCKKIKEVSGTGGVAEQWLPPQHFGSLQGRSDIELSHGYCPDCGNALKAKLFKGKQKKEPVVS